MATEINPLSYLLFSKLVNADGIEFWTLSEFPQILPQDDDIFVKIGGGVLGQFVSTEEALRIDLLSDRVYGTPQLWWVIARRNNFEIVPSAFKAGSLVIVPSPRYVFEEIITQAKG